MTNTLSPPEVLMTSPLLIERGLFFYPFKSIGRYSSVSLCSQVMHRLWNIPRDSKIKVILTRDPAPNSYKIRDLEYDRIRIGRLKSEYLLLGDDRLHELRDYYEAGPVYVAVDIYED